jgi:hemerythrin superfamily protein
VLLGLEEADIQPDVIELLAAEHEMFRRSFAQLRRILVISERRDCFEQLARDLARHEAAEEETVHPVLGQLGDEGRHLRELLRNEERDASVLIARALRLSLLRPGSRRFRHLVAEIGDAVERHAAREERTLFPLLRRTQDRAKLEMMAAWFEKAKGLGPLRPHPHSPHSLAGLLVSGPAVALLDRVRDLGRRLLEH